MTLSRLLLPRLRSRINILECRRWCSSVNNKGEISQSLKTSEVAEQQNAMAVEIFEKKHITEDEGVFPRETHVQKEVGAWNNLVGILHRTKKNFLGNHMEQKSSSTHALASTSDLKDSDNVVSADSHDSGSKNNLKITIHSEKTSVADKEENVDSETSQSSYADTSEPLEVVNMKNTSNSAAPEELLNVSSKECEEITDHRVKGMSFGASSICGKANCNDGVQLINICHHSELVEKEREPLLAEEPSSSVQINSSGEILSKSEEDIMESYKFSSNLKLERSDTSDSSCGSEKVANLVDVSQEKRNNESELEGKNDQMQREEVISDIVSIFEKKGTSNLEQVAYSNSFLLSEVTNKWRDVLVKKSVSSANEHRPAEDISSPILVKSKMEEISSVSSNSFQMMSLGDHDVEADHGAGDQVIYPKSEQSVSREFEHLSETSQNTFGKSGVIKSLIECISDLPPREPSVDRTEENVVDRSFDSSRERSANSSIEAETDKQTFDRKKSKTSSQGVVGKKEKSRRSNTVLEYLNSGVDFCKSIETKGENASFSENLSDENKVTVKFVNLKATESDVSNAFKKFGAIKKVVFPSVKSTKFKVAHVYFESEEGRQKALETSDVSIAKVVLVLEATSAPKGGERMCIPDLIGCPDVPTTLVKHPSRTAMIKNLKHNVSFHDIEKALAFCRSNITGIFFGSSSSIAYVEFETVEDKEIAVEKASLIVLGERLPILRIDTPRTTTIRISNIHFPLSKLVSVCRSLGNVREILQRASNIVDVRFDFTEWPRMLKILNRLNGVQVDGCQLVAKPAPVYSPNVLSVLWSQSEGRRHLKTTFNDMLLKLGGRGEGAVAMTEVVEKFYTDAQER
nr:PREDICTED: uncharacterized protein LOC107769893 [Nicotiana tabacum]